LFGYGRQSRSDCSCCAASFGFCAARIRSRSAALEYVVGITGKHSRRIRCMVDYGTIARNQSIRNLEHSEISFLRWFLLLLLRCPFRSISGDKCRDF
jgi:hypothetical protein